MVTLVATLVDVAIVVLVFASLRRRARRDARWYARYLAEIVRDGVDVEVAASVTLFDHAGKWGKSPGMTLVDRAGVRVDVPKGTHVFFASATPSLTAGQHVRAVFRAGGGPDGGPMRTAERREVDGNVLIAPAEPAPFEAWPRWTPVAALVSVAGVVALFADELGDAGRVISIGLGLVLLADLGFQTVLGPAFEPRAVEPIEPQIRRARVLAMIGGLAITGVALAAIAYLMPQVRSWTLRHPERASFERVDPELDGHIVAVIGPMCATSHVGDAELLAPGPEIVLDRKVEEETYVHGSAKWRPATLYDLSSQHWQVPTVHVGAHTLDLAGVDVPTTELPFDAARPRFDHVGALGWTGHGFAGGTGRIAFTGLRDCTVVTMVGVQLGSRTTPITRSTDGTTGVTITLGERDLGETVHDPWPTDERVRVCMWLALLGVLATFARVRDSLIGVGVALAIVSFGAVSGGLAPAGMIALVVVTAGLTLMTFPRSIFVVCAALLALAVPIALVRSCEASWPGYVGAGLTVLVLAVIRIAHGFERSISRA